MTTASDLIQDSLEMLGIYAPGETVSATDTARALAALNILIDEFASQNLFIYQYIPLSFSAVVARPSYTVGQSASATINTTRPKQIVYGDAAATFTVAGPTATPMNVVSAIEYQALAGFTPANGVPDTLWYNPTYPLGTVTLLPSPAVVGTVAFSVWEILQTFASAATAANLSVGVQEVLTDVLAVKLKSYFSQGQLDPIVAIRAMGARDILRYQSMNSRATFNRYALSTNPAKQNA